MTQLDEHLPAKGDEPHGPSANSGPWDNKLGRADVQRFFAVVAKHAKGRGLIITGVSVALLSGLVVLIGGAEGGLMSFVSGMAAGLFGVTGVLGAIAFVHGMQDRFELAGRRGKQGLAFLLAAVLVLLLGWAVS